MKLTEIVSQYMHALENADEDSLQEIARLDGELTQKAASIVAVVNALDDAAERYAAIARSAGERKRAIENNRKRLLDYVQANMQALNVKEIGSEGARLVLQRNGGYAELDINMQALPDEYKIKKYEEKADLDNIRIDLKAGKKIDGVVEMPRGISLRVKI